MRDWHRNDVRWIPGIATDQQERRPIGGVNSEIISIRTFAGFPVVLNVGGEQHRSGMQFVPGDTLQCACAGEIDRARTASHRLNGSALKFQL